MINAQLLRKEMIGKYKTAVRFGYKVGWPLGQAYLILSGRIAISSKEISDCIAELKLNEEKATEIFSPDIYINSLINQIKSAKEVVSYLQARLSRLEGHTNA